MRGALTVICDVPSNSKLDDTGAHIAIAATPKQPKLVISERCGRAQEDDAVAFALVWAARAPVRSAHSSGWLLKQMRQRLRGIIRPAAEHALLDDGAPCLLRLVLEVTLLVQPRCDGALGGSVGAALAAAVLDAVCPHLPSCSRHVVKV